MRDGAERRWTLRRQWWQIVLSAMAAAVVGLVLAGFSVTGFTATNSPSGKASQFGGLDMGLGVQNSHNWLKLDGNAAEWARTNNGNLDQISEYFDYVKADWVLVKFSACSGSYTMLKNWVAAAQAADKNTLISIYNLPYRGQGGTGAVRCDKAAPGTDRGTANSVIEEMAAQAQAIQSALGPGLLPSTALEVGGENNWAPDEGVNKADARLFFDVVNYTANQASGFPTVVFGGPLFKAFNSDWGTQYVSGDEYVKEAVHARSVDDAWSHQLAGIQFDVFGMHSGTCHGATQRTMWTGCDDGGNQKGFLDDMNSALSGRVSSAPIWNTSLIIGERGYPNHDPPNDGSPSGQASDTKSIWDHIRDDYTGGSFPVQLVMWNHLVDPYTDNFKCVGFMKVTAEQCINPAPNRDNYPSEYQPTALFNSAHDWVH